MYTMYKTEIAAFFLLTLHLKLRFDEAEESVDYTFK